MNTTVSARCPRDINTQSSETCAPEAKRTSNEATASEVRAMLSDLSGTPMRDGNAWDAECIARLKAFQSSEGLPATGEPDDVSIARLQARFEAVVRAPAAHGPSDEAVARVRERVKLAFDVTKSVVDNLAHDAPIRAQYINETKAFAASIIERFELGQITEGEAAHLTSSFRNEAMGLARKELSPTGKAISQFMKREGLSLSNLFEKYASRMFNKAPGALTEAERGQVALRIARQAGVTNSAVTTGARAATGASKACFAIAVAIALISIASAEDSARETVRQVASAAGAWAGAEAGAWVGGAAGMAVCGPPCLALGAALGMVAGGILGAMAAEEGADYAYTRIHG